MVKPLNAYATDATVAGSRRTINIARSAEFDFERMCPCHHNVWASAGDNYLFILWNRAVLLFHLKLDKEIDTDLAIGTMRPGSDVNIERK